MRLTKEREAEIRAHAEVDGCDGVDDLLAELDAVRAELDEAQRFFANERHAAERHSASYSALVEELRSYLPPRSPLLPLPLSPVLADMVMRASAAGFAHSDAMDKLRAERDSLLADRIAWKEEVERNAYLSEQARADAAEARADAAEAELAEWKTHLIAEDERLLLTESVVVMERQLKRACTERDAARADERAKVVAWLRAMPGTLADLADAIERGEHEVQP